MSAYTVLEPPQDRTPAGSAAERAERAERFVFIRDGFSWGAFLLAPLWLVYRRLWLGFIAYAVLTAGFHVGLGLIGVGSVGRALAAVLFALLIGFEAASLRRWTLLRRGWHEVGTVIGDGLDDAERRFFDAWIGGEVRPASRPPASSTAAANVPGLRPAVPRSDVIGLFPEPGANR